MPVAEYHAAMLQRTIEWIRAHPALMWWTAGLSVAMIVAAILTGPWIVARLPRNHFVQVAQRAGRRRRSHPAMRAALFVVKNLIGAFLVLAGGAMLFLPGQGILTILLGVALLDFPGKRRVEIALVRRKTVQRTLDWMRRRAGAAPLEYP